MEVLSQVLKKEHRAAGLCLTEDDNFVYLRSGEKVLAVFPAIGVTIKTIWDEADKYLLVEVA